MLSPMKGNIEKTMTRTEQLIAAVQQSGFPHLDSLIDLFVGGSELHGAKVKDTDDLDIYGVYLEPPELVLGLDKQDFYVWSTAGNERRNGPDDIDVCLYSLRKWAGLAAKGNPTALHFLFSANYSPRPEPWEGILKNREVFLSRQAALQFRGFADAQVRRLQGLMRSGTITLPRPEKELLITIRTGNYGSLERVLSLANTMFSELEEADAKSGLPEKVDRPKISELVSGTYLRFWNNSPGMLEPRQP
jgi:uncharacterized protein